LTSLVPHHTRDDVNDFLQEFSYPTAPGSLRPAGGGELRWGIVLRQSGKAATSKFAHVILASRLDGNAPPLDAQREERHYRAG
jgi:hypothetical protein